MELRKKKVKEVVRDKNKTKFWLTWKVSHFSKNIIIIK